MRCRSNDPGPCPVDDTPHTACTAPPLGSVTQIVRGGTPAQSLTVPLKRPGWLRSHAPAGTVPEQTVQTFTTATYKRAARGKGKRP